MRTTAALALFLGCALQPVAAAPRTVAVTDPQYQATAYTLEIPDGWKFAGTIAREPGCHGNGAALKYTAQSPDGNSAVIVMPGAAWSWSSSPSMQQIMAAQHCPGIDIQSAAAFLVNIAVPNLRPGVKIVGVEPLLPEGQSALKEQLAKARAQNAAMAAQYGQKPQKLLIDGASVRLRYARGGQPVEELITAVIECNESDMPPLYGQAAAKRRMCFSRNEVILRAPQGRFEDMRAQLKALGMSLRADPQWQSRLARDQQVAFQKMQAANDANFRQNLRNNQAAFDQRLAENKAFQANMRASTDRALANDRARQDAIDASAHATALHSLDRQEFKNPATGQTIEASSSYNHQWLSSDGNTLIQTNDAAFDPNGQVRPVSQSWSELVPK